jgi:hypothetical protein
VEHPPIIYDEHRAGFPVDGFDVVRPISASQNGKSLPAVGRGCRHAARVEAHE